ncbi:MAG TPA: hypothetical protein VFP91_03400 [Vicinamibacterales bacterium]|nr:hypothetical protein [Vicinamibacterales bacterium]
MNHAEQATFFRAALLLGLIRGERVVAWADAVLATEDCPHAAFAEIATTPADDLTVLRQRLLLVGREKESETVVRALAGLVHRDLASGRRTLGDTMTVLKQFRAFVAVGPVLNEQIKTLGVDVAMAAPDTPQRGDAEGRVRAWLAGHEHDAVPFLE